jgi:Flp pilus assembly protein TadG
MVSDAKPRWRFLLNRHLNPFRRLLGDRSGVSAVEFALILPIMLTLYLGGNEFGHALTIKRKVTHVASTVADLITQSKSVTNADIENIFNVASAIMTPYSASDVTIRVAMIKIDADNNATVMWSAARHETPLVADSPVTLPDEVDTADTYVLSTEVHFPYHPAIGFTLTGPIDLWDLFYLRPRQGSYVHKIGG